MSDRDDLEPGFRMTLKVTDGDIVQITKITVGGDMALG